MERIKEIIKDMNELLPDANTFYGNTRGAKSSATRLRVGLQNIIKKIKTTRAEIQEIRDKRKAAE